MLSAERNAMLNDDMAMVTLQAGPSVEQGGASAGHGMMSDDP